jgi:hypothetical protein
MNPADESHDSLISALNKAHIPSANHTFIQLISDAVGISGYHAVEASTRYVRAFRRGGLGELRIYSGYTIGFTKDEADRVGVSADTVRQSSKNKTWLVSHPEHGDLEPRGQADRKAQREADFCEGCGEQLSLTGACNNCDD